MCTRKWDNSGLRSVPQPKNLCEDNFSRTRTVASSGTSILTV